MLFRSISLLEVEDELQALQMSIITLSTDWGRTPNYKQVGKLKGTRFIDHAIHCKEFWIRGKTIAQVLRPLLQALCLVMVMAQHQDTCMRLWKG